MPTWDFDTPGPLRLALEIPIGQVEIESVEGSTTHVDLDGSADVRDLIEAARVELGQRGAGQELRVEVRRRSGFFISFGHQPELRLRIACPVGAEISVESKSADVRTRGRSGAVDIKTASGDVSLDEVAGDARVKTASGDVSLWEGHGLTQVQSASGDVALQRVHGEAIVQAVSGDVWIREADSSVRANTVSGDQRLEAVQDGNVESQSVSGDVLIGIRRGSRVFVDANTISGDTSSELELTDAPASDEPAADAPTVEVRAKTVSGDIAIIRAAAPAPKPSIG